MTGLGEDVYTAPDHFSDVSKMVDEAAKAIYDREYIRGMNERFYAKELAICANKARAALESLGVDLSVLAALRSGEWVAIPAKMTSEHRDRINQLADEGDGDLYNYPVEDGYVLAIKAAPNTPEDMR